MLQAMNDVLSNLENGVSLATEAVPQAFEGVMQLAKSPQPPITVIKPHSSWRLVDWKELLDYRDLFLFLVWRNIKVQYAQSTLGIGWAVIQPLFSMVIFTIVF